MNLDDILAYHEFTPGNIGETRALTIADVVAIFEAGGNVSESTVTVKVPEYLRRDAPWTAHTTEAQWYSVEAAFYCITDKEGVVVAYVKRWSDAEYQSKAIANLIADSVNAMTMKEPPDGHAPAITKTPTPFVWWSDASDAVYDALHAEKELKHDECDAYLSAVEISGAIPLFTEPQLPALSDDDRATFSRVLDCLEILNARPRPMCRDCADCSNDGVCSNDGLNCSMTGLITKARAIIGDVNAMKGKNGE